MNCLEIWVLDKLYMLYLIESAEEIEHVTARQSATSYAQDQEMALSHPYQSKNNTPQNLSEGSVLQAFNSVNRCICSKYLECLFVCLSVCMLAWSATRELVKIKG